jgi:HEAT repeat protein
VTLRRGAAIGLARMGDRRSMAPLLKVARNTNEQQILRAGAITALGFLCQRNPYPPFARVSIDSSFDVENEAVDLLRDLL